MIDSKNRLFVTIMKYKCQKLYLYFITCPSNVRISVHKIIYLIKIAITKIPQKDTILVE